MRKDFETNTIYDDMEKSCRSISPSEFQAKEREEKTFQRSLVSAYIEIIEINHRADDSGLL